MASMTKHGDGCCVQIADHEALQRKNADLEAALARVAAPISVKQLKRRGIQGLCAIWVITAVNDILAERALPAPPDEKENHGK